MEQLKRDVQEKLQSIASEDYDSNRAQRRASLKLLNKSKTRKSVNYLKSDTRRVGDNELIGKSNG